MGFQGVIIDAPRQRVQKRRFLHPGGRSRQHRDPLSTIEHTVAGGTVADAAAQQFFFTGKKYGPGCTHAQDDSPSFQHVVFRQQQEAIPTRHNLTHQRVFFFRAQRQCLLTKPFQQFFAGNLRQTGVIVDPLCAAEPASRFRRGDHGGAQAAHPGRHGAGPACGAIADNRYIHKLFLLCHSFGANSV